MESVSGFILIGIGLMVGALIGFLLARLRHRDHDRDAKLVALQKEYDDYRTNVRSHFVDTVTVLQKIDEQQKALYRSVVDGVTDLCRPEDEIDDYFIEQTKATLGQLESPKEEEKDRKNVFEVD